MTFYGRRWLNKINNELNNFLSNPYKTEKGSYDPFSVLYGMVYLVICITQNL